MFSFTTSANIVNLQGSMWLLSMCLVALRIFNKKSEIYKEANMSITAQNRTIPDWFTHVRLGYVVLPRFQRYEAWSHATIAQLFNTVLQGLPVGAMLVLKVGELEPFVTRPIVGAPKLEVKSQEHLLDGQQRLTALWRGLHNNYEDRTYFLYLKEDDSGSKFYVDSISRYKKESDKESRPVWANKPVEQWSRKMIPLNLLAPGESVTSELLEWIDAAIQDENEKKIVRTDLINIRGKIAAFNLPYLALESNTSRETALDVFIKMNTSAAPLSIYDIVVAQVETDDDESLHERVSDMKQLYPNMA